MSLADNKRLFPRIPFYETILIRRPDKADASPGNSVDLSRQGISVHCDSPLWPGKRCILEFDIPIKPQPRKVVVECESWHCGLSASIRGYRIGLLFIDSDSEHLRLIDEYVRSLPEEILDAGTS